MAYDPDSMDINELRSAFQSADASRKIFLGLERFANNGMVLFASYGAMEIPRILSAESNMPTYIAAGAMVVTAALGRVQGYADELLFENDANLADLQTRIDGLSDE